MRESFLAVPGLIFLVLGALVFFIASETRVYVEISPYSFVLISVFVAGFLLLGVGLANFIEEKLE